MKAVILAGGMGTRISEESHLRPKPMIEIGGRPILWHVMNIYTAYGVTDFVICLGYRGYMIKEYFANHVLHESDMTVDARTREITYHTNYAEPWRVTLVDTGLGTMTGGRLKRIGRYLDSDDSFCMTYGDGVANIDIAALLEFHQRHGKLATITAVVPPGRYGALLMDGDLVTRFSEKPPGDNALINGGFFVLHPSVLERIEGDDTPWETAPLESLARGRELCAYRATPASGSRWTRCATRRRSRHSGRLAGRRGRCGATELERPAPPPRCLYLDNVPGGGHDEAASVRPLGIRRAALRRARPEPATGTAAGYPHTCRAAELLATASGTDRPASRQLERPVVGTERYAASACDRSRHQRAAAQAVTRLDAGDPATRDTRRQSGRGSEIGQCCGSTAM